MAKIDLIKVEVWTERFLGTKAKGAELVDLLHQLDGGRWIPEKWDQFEPVRRAYQPTSAAEILDALTEVRHGDISNNLNFIKKRPHFSLSLSVWRSTVPFFNRVRIDFDAKELSGVEGPERIISIVRELVVWSGAVLASARHTKQDHWRVAQSTPRERLQEMDWLTFLGKPYMDFFGGRDRIVKAPCHSVRDLDGGLVLIAAPRPDSPEMTDNSHVLLQLEEYLGADAFAGRGYPEVPCRVPTFDLSETVTA